MIDASEADPRNQGRTRNNEVVCLRSEHAATEGIGRDLIEEQTHPAPAICRVVVEEELAGLTEEEVVSPGGIDGV